MIAMASQNDRRQAKEKRNRDTATARITGVNSQSPHADDSLFPMPAVRVRRDDELSQRMKGLFENAHHLASSPHHPMPNIPTHDRPVHTHPGGAAGHMSQTPDRHSSKSKDSKKKSEGNEHKHKHKDRDKEKKRKSSHGDERHSKKSKTDKSHSPAPKDHSSAPKKVTHRSSSVCSDRSDLSAKSDRQFSNSKHEHSQSKGSKSKHTSSSSSSHTPGSHSTSSSTHGASSGNKGATNKYSGDQSNGVVGDAARSHSSKSKGRDDPPINGLVRGGPKPTNLVIPSINGSGTKNDKEDLAVKKILAEMMNKPTEKITEIQTPCKSDLTSPYQFKTLTKPTETLSNQLDSISKPSKSKPMSIGSSTEPKEKVKPSATLPVKLTNGDLDDLKLSPSNADSDSASSSSNDSSGSSSSSSSSGSGSESSDDEASPTKKEVAMLFPGTGTSPAPVADYCWDLSTYYTPNDTDSSVKSDRKPAIAAKPSHSMAASRGSDASLKGGRKRGRPRKEESAKRNPDPDFTPPVGGKQMAPVPAPTVTTDRTKRQPSSSKPSKSEGAKGQASKRGRPRKKADGQMPSAMSSNKSIISTTISQDRSTANEHASNPSAPKSLSALSSSSMSDEDCDVDVDCISEKSPNDLDTSPPPPVKSEPKIRIKNLPGATGKSENTFGAKVKTENSYERKIKTENIYERVPPKHEPISPVETTNSAKFPRLTPSAMDSHHGNDTIRTLVVRIPLSQLLRPPLPPETLRPSASIMDVPSLPGLKEERLSPVPSKRKSTPSSSFQQLMKEAKNPRKAVRELDEDVGVDMAVSSTADFNKESLPLATVPAYQNAQMYHEKGRELKNRCTAMASTPNSRPMKNLLALEAVVTFMMTGIAKEADNPMNISAIKQYYSSTLAYAEVALAECFKESNSTQPRIHRCCQVLCDYAIAHMKHKRYKLLKDQASSCSRRIEEFLHREKSKSSISPHNHNHTGLPPGNSPAAPSPASITSTGSITSDCSRGTSLPPNSSVTISETMLKDVGEYLKCMTFLSSSVDHWKKAQLYRSQPEQKEFFDKLDRDLEYSVELLTEGRPLVHYVHTGCLRLKDDLDEATSLLNHDDY